MRHLGLWCCVAVLVGCEKPKERPAGDTAATATATPAAGTSSRVSFADVAGKWTMRTMPESGDTTLVTYELVAGSDSSSWVINFPKRKPIPVRVTASGDSL